MEIENQEGGNVQSNETDTTVNEGQQQDSFFEESGIDLLGDTAMESESMDEQDSVEEDNVNSNTFNINGEEYDINQIQEAIQAQQNRDEWSRINTQRAQELAAEREALQAERQQYQEFLQNLQKDKEVSEKSPDEIQFENWLEGNGYIRKEDIEKYIEERIAPLQETTQTIQQSQGMKMINDEFNALVQDGKVTPEEKNDLFTFAVQNNVDHLPLEDVWILMNKDKIQQTAQESAKKQMQIDQERKAKVGKIMPTRGVNSNTQTKYNPKTDRNKSITEVLFEKYL